MNLFILLSICAGACWAVTNVLDDAIVRRWNSNDFVELSIWACLSRIAIIPIFILFNFLTIPSLSDVLLSLSVGMISFIGMYAYYRALEIGEIVGLAVISESSPLVVLVVSLMLGAELNAFKVIGVITIVVGSILVAVKIEDIRKIEIRRETYWITLATISFAFVSLLADVSTRAFQNDFAQVGWIWVGLFSSGLMYLAVSRIINGCNKHFNVDNITPRIGVYFLVGLVSETLGYIVFFKSLEIGEVAIASGLSSVRPIFVLLISLLIPASKTTRLSKKRLLSLVLAGILMIFGGYLTQI